MSIRDAAFGVAMTFVAAVAVIGTLIALAALAGPAGAQGGGGGAGSGGGGGGGGTDPGYGQEDGWLFPLPSKHTYGDGVNPPDRPHDGQDIFAKCGRKLVAANDGKVIRVGSDSGYGNMLVISVKGTDNDIVYAHMRKKSEVREGEKVTVGQKVGEVGDTGNASGCHLHFELLKGEFWNGGKPMKKVTKYLKAWDKYS